MIHHHLQELFPNLDTTDANENEPNSCGVDIVTEEYEPKVQRLAEVFKNLDNNRYNSDAFSETAAAAAVKQEMACREANPADRKARFQRLIDAFLTIKPIRWCTMRFCYNL